MEGSRRYVFQHPHQPELLVKVLKSEEGKEISLGLPGLRLQRPNEMTRSFQREIGESLRARAQIPQGPLPIARVFGIVDTDLGTGLLVERIAGHDGGLAPSLRVRVRERGFDDGLEHRILALRDEVIRSGLVTGDVNTNNIVVGCGADGADRLVIVDGIGDKTFLPVNSLIPFINRRSLRRRFARIIVRLRELDSQRK
jgi:hypothetical protein